ncbi:hypothetical protein HPB51_002253 [Rhipicephalus microplus]|uniref:Uncharacterized protein n=1 Tax=Rhipicephalus microplus TaxID=6941 RepID=A0A9J6E5W8_RHIMP|nr:proline-rich receptor-like protein kinase PERK10 [Rhipicephalus microplus]KAH8029674.1 hypothetical protein HPB51_002253 [Rhipicephalus microplus]
MATAGQFGEIPLECTYWSPIETGLPAPGPVYLPPPEFIGVFLPPPVPVLEVSDPLTPYDIDPAASAARLQKLLRLPPSYPWTPGPTLPTDDVAYGRGFGYTTPPLPLWLKPAFVYGTAPNMYVPRPTLEPIVPAATPSASPAWTPPPPVRRHMPHFRNGPTPPPPGGRRTREGMRPPSSQTTETPVGASDSGEFSPDLPAEPDSEIADQLLQKKKKAASKAGQPVSETTDPAKESAEKLVASQASNHTGARPKVTCVYSAIALKSLNVGGCEHVSPSGERATLSEPRIEYCWPDETPTEQEEEPVAYLRAAEAKPTEPPRAKSSMQDRGRKLGSPRDRGPRRHYSVTAW